MVAPMSFCQVPGSVGADVQKRCHSQGSSTGGWSNFYATLWAWSLLVRGEGLPGGLPQGGIYQQPISLQLMTAQGPVTMIGATRFHSQDEVGWPPVRGHPRDSVSRWAWPGQPLQSARPGSCHPTTALPSPWAWGSHSPAAPIPHCRRGGLPLPRAKLFSQTFSLPPADGRRGAAQWVLVASFGGRYQPDDAG